MSVISSSLKHQNDNGEASVSRDLPARKIFLRQLQLTHYRNYASLKQDFSPGCVVFTGHNGAGKTNLLEAISLLSPGRGLRRAAYSDIPSLPVGYTDDKISSIKNGNFIGDISRNFAVCALLESPFYGEVQIGTGLAAPRSGDGKYNNTGSFSRRVQINGVGCSADSLSEYCRIIWLIPAQDGLFAGAAGERRRFLDRMVLALDTAHARRVIGYEKIMRSRNRLLAEGSHDTHFLDALEAQMAALATAIGAARLDVVSRLDAITDPLFYRIGFPQTRLQVEGFVENALSRQAAVDVEECLCQKLRENREKDRLAGRSLVGTHRSDLLVWHKKKNMPAALCSTGEQKALLTGLILAHTHLTTELSGMTPIVLLDEIAAHFDEKRRIALFTVLEDLQVQAFMTGTDKTFFSVLHGRADFFKVYDGILEPE